MKRNIDKLKRTEIYQNRDEIELEPDLNRSDNLQNLEEVDGEEEKQELKAGQLDSSGEWNTIKPKEFRSLAEPSNYSIHPRILPNFDREKYRQAVAMFKKRQQEEDVFQL